MTAESGASRDAFDDRGSAVDCFETADVGAPSGDRLSAPSRLLRSLSPPLLPPRSDFACGESSSNRSGDGEGDHACGDRARTLDEGLETRLAGCGGRAGREVTRPAWTEEKCQPETDEQADEHAADQRRC